MSTTSEMLTRVQNILNDPKNQKGPTRQEIWQKLTEDKDFAKVMYNAEGDPRGGLLLGIIHRVKDGKIPGLVQVKATDGRSLIMADDRPMAPLVRQLENFLKTAGNLAKPQKMTSTMVKWYESYKEEIGRLQKLADETVGFK